MEITIDDAKLNEIVEIYNKHANASASYDVIKIAILNDWEDEEDHQAWLNESSAEEIADWLASFLDSDDSDDALWDAAND